MSSELDYFLEAFDQQIYDFEGLLDSRSQAHRNNNCCVLWVPTDADFSSTVSRLDRLHAQANACMKKNMLTLRAIMHHERDTSLSCPP